MTSADRSRLTHALEGSSDLSTRSCARNARCAVVFAALALTCTVSATAPAQIPPPAPGTTLAQIIRGVARAPFYEEAQIAPDARHVAWVQRTSDPDLRSIGAALFVAPVRGRAAATAVTALPESGRTQGATERAIAWAPDSRSLAFLSDAQLPGQMQLYVWRLGDTAPRRLTQLEGTLASPRFSPDGTRIALLHMAHADRGAGPLVAVPAPTGVIGEEVREQSLVLVEVATGAIRPLSAPDRYVYEYDWSPRGDAIVAIAAHGSGDDHWYGAQLVIFDTASGTERVLLEPPMQIAAPRWSPDARSIAFLGGLMSDESVAAGDLYVISSKGGAPRNLTPGFSGSVFASLWTADSRRLVLTAARDGGAAILALDPTHGRLETLWSGPETLTALRDLAFSISLARDGRQSAVIRQSFEQPPSVWVGLIGSWRQRSAQPAPPPPYGQARSVRWRNEGLELQGWLIPPARLEPGRRYPLVVSIHGGPAWLIAQSWPTLDADSLGALLASQGYFVFFPNVRGSTGYGEQVTRANFRDLGGAPLRDILAAVQQLLRDHPLDPRRVGLTGWSYGGYMTMWALTQTSIFRAAVAGAGVANWQSYTGENGIDASLVPYFGATVYDDPDIYARNSPINFVKQVRTPTLIVVGDSDVECPAPQSYEYWHALKTLGVPTQLVVYPHEGHEFADPDHIIDYLERSRDWFDRYMPAAAPDQHD